MVLRLNSLSPGSRGSQGVIGSTPEPFFPTGTEGSVPTSCKEPSLTNPVSSPPYLSSILDF